MSYGAAEILPISDSRILGDFQARNIPVIDLHELTAGKLAALFARHQARDLFDAHQLLTKARLDPVRLRVAFVVYGALNRKDWRTLSLDEIAADPKEFERMLASLQRRDPVAGGVKIKEFTKKLVEECRERLSAVYPLSAQERDFLDHLLDQGELRPDILTGDPNLQERIGRHPMLRWKAQHVQKHFGLP